MKRYLICYRRKNDNCCHRQREFDSYREVCEFIVRIIKRGSKVLKLYDHDIDITPIIDPMLRFHKTGFYVC